jgi:PAS domain S-box-containing protein
MAMTRKADALQRATRALAMREALETGVEALADEQSIFALTCSIVVGAGGHTLAWVGKAEHDPRRTVRPIAHAGKGSEEVVSNEVLWSASERGSGPTGTAIRTRVPCVMADLASNPRTSPWLTTTLRQRLAVALSLPIVIDGEIFGALTVFDRHAGAFDPEEIGLLVGLVRSAVHAIEKLRGRDAERLSKVERVEAERRFKTIFDGARSLMTMLGPDGSIQELNETALRRAGLTMDVVRGRKLWELPHHVNGAPLAAAIERLVHERARVQVEVEVSFPDGPAVLDVSLAPLLDEQTREVQAILADARDVTAEREAEQRLRQSARRFGRMLDSGWDVVTLRDATGRCLYASGSCARVLGLSPDEMMLRPLGERVHPDDEATVHAAFFATQTAKGASRRCEVRFRHRDGEWRWLQALSVNLLDDPDVGAIMTIARDVTERKATEHALATSEQQLLQIADHGRDVLWVVDPVKARVVYVSPAYASIWGRLPPVYEARPRDWLAAVERDDLDGIRRAFDACAVDKRRVEMSARVRQRDGSLRHLRATASPVLDGDGIVTRIVGVVRDVTEDRGADSAPKTLRRRAR